MFAIHLLIGNFENGNTRTSCLEYFHTFGENCLQNWVNSSNIRGKFDNVSKYWQDRKATVEKNLNECQKKDLHENTPEESFNQILAPDHTKEKHKEGIGD